MRNPQIQALAVTALLLAAACDNVTTAPAPQAKAPVAPATYVQLGSVTCTVDVAAGRSRCGDVVAPGGASRTLVTLDSTWFDVITTNQFHNSTTQQDNIFNEIENDLGQDIGTHDGIIASTIRAYVTSITVTGGSGTVTASNHDGTGTLTAANQPYWNIDEIIPGNGGQSLADHWVFNVPNTVTQWRYVVHLSAPIAHPNGWVDVSGDEQVPYGDTRYHTATVFDWTGAVVDTGAVSWNRTNISGNLYIGQWDDRTALLLGVLPGTAEVTASFGTATPRVYGVEITP